MKERKKRGRKPKGGKIIHCSEMKPNTIHSEKNVVVHLKCSSNDLKETSFLSDMLYKPDIETVKAYEEDQTYKHIEKEKQEDYDHDTYNDKVINEKLKELHLKFHKNIISTKQSACFWCTCDFESQIIYIPKHKINAVYEVYGCFCRPECALAYLCSENIDTSTKWERYALLNSIYAPIFKYTTQIKPAADPRYTLQKYFGNLTIEEYRNMNRNSQSTLILLNKPISRVLPELYESSSNIDIHDRFYNHIVNTGFKLSRNQMKQNIWELYK